MNRKNFKLHISSKLVNLINIPYKNSFVEGIHNYWKSSNSWVQAKKGGIVWMGKYILCFQVITMGGPVFVRTCTQHDGVDAPGQIRGDTVRFKEAVNYQKIEDCRWHGLMPRVKPKEPIRRGIVPSGNNLSDIWAHYLSIWLDRVKKKWMGETFDRSKFIFIVALVVRRNCNFYDTIDENDVIRFVLMCWKITKLISIILHCTQKIYYHFFRMFLNFYTF